MEASQYYILPQEGYPDKIIKISNDITFIISKSHEGNELMPVNTDLFKRNLKTPLIEIKEDEYDRRYEEFFGQYIAEKKNK